MFTDALIMYFINIYNAWQDRNLRKKTTKLGKIIKGEICNFRSQIFRTEGCQGERGCVCWNNLLYLQLDDLEKSTKLFQFLLYFQEYGHFTASEVFGVFRKK